MAERRWHQLYFEDWVAKEGLDLSRGHHVRDVYTMPLKPWERTDQLKGIFADECAKRGAPACMEAMRGG